MTVWIIYGKHWIPLPGIGNINRVFGEKAYLDPKTIEDIFVPMKFKYVYPHMGYFASGFLNDNIYDIDFNNFYIQALIHVLENPIVTYKKIVLPHEFAKKADDVFSVKADNPVLKDAIEGLVEFLKNELRRLMKERDKLKNNYVVIATNKLNELKLVKAKKVFLSERASEFPIRRDTAERRIKEATEQYAHRDEGLTYQEALDIAYYLYKNGMATAIVSDYEFRKYSILAAIGNFRHHNDNLWKLVMSYAASVMEYTLVYAEESGVTLYNVYVDSIQVNENILDFPVFKYYPAKVDKRGEPYALILPPLYSVGTHFTEFLIKNFKIDKDRFFRQLIEDGVFRASTLMEKRMLASLKDLCIKYDSEFAKTIKDDAMYLPDKLRFYGKLVLWNEERQLVEKHYMELKKVIKEATDRS